MNNVIFNGKLYFRKRIEIYSFKVNKLVRFLYFNWLILFNLIIYLLIFGKME